MVIQVCPGSPTVSAKLSCSAGAALCCAGDTPADPRTATNANSHLFIFYGLIPLDSEPSAHPLLSDHNLPERVEQHGTIYKTHQTIQRRADEDVRSGIGHAANQ